MTPKPKTFGEICEGNRGIILEAIEALEEKRYWDLKAGGRWTKKRIYPLHRTRALREQLGKAK